jgi:uncharacterized membrane protein
MTDIFMRSPLPNTLAVIVLIALISTWLISIIRSMGQEPVEADKGWVAVLLPAFSILGIPAAVDLIQTKGATALYAGVVFLVFVLNILIPILRITGKTLHPLVLDWYKWSILISSIGGLVVAGYLTFVEATGGPVVCGPSQGCEAVQNSKYAILFGVLPIGVLGLVGYVAILIAWVAWQFGPESIRKLASLAIWGMSIFGVLFSVYLTFLEPFVIGATCMWCISSAVLMITLLLLSTPAAQQALAIPDED